MNAPFDKKVLFITPEVPHPLGGGQRMYYMLKYLHQAGVAVDVLTPKDGQPQEQEQRLRHIQQFCRHCFAVDTKRNFGGRVATGLLGRAYYYFPAFKHELERLLRQGPYDLIHVQKFQMAEYVMDVRSVPVVIDLWACGLGGAWNDVVYAESLTEKILRLSRLIRYAIADFRYYRRFAHYFTVSAEARDYIIKRYPGKNVFVVPNGIEIADGLPEIRPEEASEPSLIYTGDMSFFPNVDAVVYFSKAIYPRIKRAVPHARFTVAGVNPRPEVLRLAEEDPSITVTGYVPNIREHLSKAHVVVVPLRAGSGIRNKLLEAFACRKPVVSTTQALEGIKAVPGREVYAADQPEVFAATVIDLLRDKEKRADCGEKAFQLVKAQYHWPVIVSAMIEHYRRMVRDSR